jgi:hypothetical protein
MAKSDKIVIKYNTSRPFSVITGWGTPLSKGVKDYPRDSHRSHARRAEERKAFLKKKHKYIKIEDTWEVYDKNSIASKPKTSCLLIVTTLTSQTKSQIMLPCCSIKF